MIVIYAVVSSFEKLNPKIPDPVLSSKHGEIKIKRYKNKNHRRGSLYKPLHLFS